MGRGTQLMLVDPMKLTKVAFSARKGDYILLSKEQCVKIFGRGALKRIAQYRKMLREGIPVPPVKLNRYGYIVDGAHRVLAAQQMGMPKIRVVKV